MSTKQKIILAITIPALFVWSWVLVVDATKITDSSLVSDITRLAVLILNTTVTTFIFYQVVKFLQKLYKTNPKSPLFLIQAFFVIAFSQWFVAWILAFIWFGRDASFDSLFPFASLSPFLAYTPLRFLFTVFGFFGTSALLITVVIGLFLKKQRRFALLAIVFSACIGASTWLYYRKPSGSPQTITTVSETLGHLQQTKSDADLVVFPEYGLDGIDSSNISQRISEKTNKEVFFVGSKQQPGKLGIRNTFMFGSTQQGIIEEQSKTRLIAGGEYLPYTLEYALKITGQSATVLTFEVTKGVEKDGSALKTYRVNEDLIVGPAVCSSIIAPEDYRHLTNSGATVLTNSASLGVFGGSRVYRIMHNGMARFMATANARPFVQSAQDEGAFILNHQGNQIAYIEPVNEITTRITTNDKKTLYTIVGDWPVYVGLLFVSWFVYNYSRKSKKKSN